MSSSCMRTLACTAVLVLGWVMNGYAQAPEPPTGLNPQVTGPFVQISWNPSAGAVTFIVQAGSSPGASNLFNGSVGSTTTVGGGPLPNGTYFWRVLAVGASGAASAPSAESQFVIGGDVGCTPPGAPQGFTATVSGVFVTLRWSAGGGGAPSSYVIEAGSANGQANLAVLPTGNPGTEFSTPAPAGRYFLRIRSQNACGTSGPSNEQVIDVGGAPPDTGGCSYALSPASVNASAAGQQFQVNVAAGGGCRWQLQASAFITPSSLSGTGAGTATFTIGAAAATRTGQITLSPVDAGPVTGGTVTVQQTVGGGGGNCAISLNPTSQQVTPTGGTFQVRVTAGAGCAWTVTPLAGFISIVSAGLTSGSDTVIYLVAPNPAEANRMAGVRVTSTAGSQDLSVIQQGVGPLTASFVMREGGQIVTVCQVNEGRGCSLDATASSPANQIVAYEWTTTRFTLTGSVTNNYTGVTPALDLGCTTGGNSQELFDVTLTVRNAAGQSVTATRQLSLTRAGCGT